MKTMVLICTLVAGQAFSQQIFNPHTFQWNGYLKSMQSWSFPDRPSVYSSHLLHNRIQLKWQPDSSFQFGAAWRTRIISGDEVRMYADYTERLKNPNDRWNAAILWFSNRDITGITNTERLWASFKRNKFFIRAGRQRINWSTTTTWNPNDIFNSYNFLDFDYEERPGCDGLQTRYLIHQKSNIEVSIAWAGHTGKTITAIKYFHQYRNWDLQFIAGMYEDKLTLGGAWASSIGGAGWKGEWQYFQQNHHSVVNISSEIDYLFRNSWYLKAGLLYNSRGSMQPVQNRDQLQFKMTPLQQMPGAWNLEFMGMKTFNPIVKASVMTVYAPSIALLILIPACTFSLSENTEADIILQHFWLKEKDWRAIQQNGFLRLKWSF